jgi:hypothetical protein
MASLIEAQRIERAKRAEFLRGERRFVFGLLAVIIAIAWAASALTGN